MKVLPLVGYKALVALRAFHVLLLGYKMLPISKGESYEKFYYSLREKTEAEKETLIREALVFVELSEEEVDALISFATDQNGVPFSDVNKKNLSVDKLHETMVAICMEIGRIKVEILSEAEKKNFPISQ